MPGRTTVMPHGPAERVIHRQALAYDAPSCKNSAREWRCCAAPAVASARGIALALRD